MVNDKYDDFYQKTINERLREQCEGFESIIRTIRKEQKLLEEYLGIVLTTEQTYKKKESNGN